MRLFKSAALIGNSSNSIVYPSLPLCKYPFLPMSHSRSATSLLRLNLCHLEFFEQQYNVSRKWVSSRARICRMYRRMRQPPRSLSHQILKRLFILCIAVSKAQILDRDFAIAFIMSRSFPTYRTWDKKEIP